MTLVEQVDKSTQMLKKKIQSEKGHRKEIDHLKKVAITFLKFQTYDYVPYLFVGVGTIKC